MFFFKFSHVTHQRLDAGQRHGVVQAGAHAAQSFVALELQQAARFGADFLAVAMKVPPFSILQTGLQPGALEGSGARVICSNRA